MNVRWISGDHKLRAGRGDVVVCIPVYGAHEQFVMCLHSVLAHTPAEVPILICDDASPDARSREIVARLEQAGETDHKVFYLCQEHNVGFPANVNAGFAVAAPADVVVLNSDCVVAEGWLAGLRDAAFSDSRVATATALTNNGTLVSVPERRPLPALPQAWSLEDAAAAIRARSLRIYPRLPTAIGHCVYVRRAALELVGDFDLAFTPGYGEEVDFSQRCRKSGLCHVLADDVFVLHHGAASFSSNGNPSPVQEDHERIIAIRYPYYHDEVRALEQDVTGPLARALSAARRALKGLSVLIDARILSGPLTGTQIQVMEVIGALARTGRVRLTVLIQDAPSDYAMQALADMANVSVVTRSHLAAHGGEPADVVHRPFQITEYEDIAYLGSLGGRVIVTNQDLIGYHNPSYFRDGSAWDDYRRTTRMALAVADHVVFVSAHARDDALADDLVDPHRATAVHNGVDHSLLTAAEAPVPPRAAAALPADAEAILCLGTDFRHKNRLFALRMLRELQLRHGWPGYLVFAGPRVQYGSSTPDEAELLALQPTVARRVLDVAAVTEAEKTWLFDRARLVLYPTVHEGFGLVPFEAAGHGVPCMWAAGTSLSEVLPDEAAQIVPWDPAQSADRALELMRGEQERERNLRLIRSAGEALSWDAAARKLIEIYEATCDAPAAPAGVGRGQRLIEGELSEDAMRLLGPGGVLPRDIERPLLALATHPQIGDPLFRAIRAGYRASFRLRRLGG